MLIDYKKAVDSVDRAAWVDSSLAVPRMTDIFNLSQILNFTGVWGR